ncbi:MAG: hypothetical protein KUG79_05825 [Pseudomonadales bacterium]|nr:hypothetical protein [Pseudomonadales bacterium]
MKPDQTAASQPLDMLVSSLLYLMTRYNHHRCPKVHQAIASHLIMLRDHPGASYSVAMVNTARRLANEWSAAAEIPLQKVATKTPLTVH